MTQDDQTLLQRITGFVFPRMGLWLWLSIGLIVLIWILAPHMVKVSAYKLSLITIAAYVGYWISRGLEGGVRPHDLERTGRQLIACSEPDQVQRDLKQSSGYDMLRRAEVVRTRRCYIVCAVMLAVALGS